MDMIILHMFSDETVRRCVDSVRTAAEQAGRDPAAVRVWSCDATVHDGLSYEVRLQKTVGRLASYLQGYGDLMVATNHWDPAALERFRTDRVISGFHGSIDERADVETLEHIRDILSEEWLEPAATGSSQRCAERGRIRIPGADACMDGTPIDNKVDDIRTLVS